MTWTFQLKPRYSMKRRPSCPCSIHEEKSQRVGLKLSCVVLLHILLLFNAITSFWVRKVSLGGVNSLIGIVSIIWLLSFIWSPELGIALGKVTQFYNLDCVADGVQPPGLLNWFVKVPDLQVIGSEFGKQISFFMSLEIGFVSKLLSQAI